MPAGMVRAPSDRSRLSLASQAVETQTDAAVMDKFWTLASDEERLALLWQQPILHDILVFEPEFVAKSNEQSIKYREAGNKYFQQNRHFNALEEYNKCVLFANGEAGEGEGVVNELSLAYANRSAALFHLKKYGAAIRDIDSALQRGYPQKMLYKIHERKGKCLRALGHPGEAVDCFNTALTLLQDAQLPDDRTLAWRKSIEKDIADATAALSNGNEATANGARGQGQVTSSARWNVPTVLGHPNDVYHSLSNVVDVKYEDKRGRHLVTNCDVKPGDVLLVEKPYASVMYEEAYARRCYTCFRRTAVPEPCLHCATVCFCSATCRDAAWLGYHQYECHYMATYQRDWCGRMGHLAARIAMVTGLDTMLADKSSTQGQGQGEAQRNLKEKAGFNDQGTYGNDYAAVRALVVNSSRRSKADYLQLTVLAASLVKMLKGGGFIPADASEQTLVAVGGRLLHYLQTIQCNAHVIQDVQNPDAFEDLKMMDVGIGLYSSASLINHSCDPNVEITNYGDIMVVRATRNIAAGEEAAMSYGPLYYKERLSRRQNILQSVHLFTCRCEACTDKWGVFEELDRQYPTFRCEDCRKPLSMEEVVEERFVTCSSCGAKHDVAEVLTRLGASHELYSQAMQRAICGEGPAALPDLVSHVTLMQRCLCSPWRDLVSCQAAICNIYRLMAHLDSPATE